MGNFISTEMIEDIGYKMSKNHKMVRSYIYYSFGIFSIIIYLHYLYLKNWSINSLLIIIED